MSPKSASVLIAALLLAAAGEPASPAGASPLSAGPRLTHAYALLYNGSTDQASAEFQDLCAQLPDLGACDAHRAVAAWWRIRNDPDDDSRERLLSALIERAIAETDAWTRREGRSAEAWFYVGAAYGVRIQLRVLRGQRLAAARDGKRVKEAVERAIGLDPTFYDAYFGLGLYHYYADVVPTMFKLFRWLLLLPGGDRKEGLDELRLARDRGTITRAEATYQLALIKLWYEHDEVASIGLLKGLAAQYPDNPFYPLQLADIYRDSLHDSASSMAMAGSVLDEARRDRPNYDRGAEMRARYSLALTYQSRFETDRAIAQLEQMLEDRAAGPRGLLPRALLALGQAYDQIAEHARAVPMYREAAAATRKEEIRERALTLARRTPDAAAGAAYRRTLEAERLYEQHRYADAEALLRQVLAVQPGQPIARYYLGEVLVAEHRTEEALAAFEAVIAGQARHLPTVLADAYLAAARLRDRRGDRAAAIPLYRAVTRIPGADAATVSAANRELEHR